MLDESICHFLRVLSQFYRFYTILMENPVSKQYRHYVASDLGLHCLPTTLLWVTRKEWINCCVTLSVVANIRFVLCDCSISV